MRKYVAALSVVGLVGAAAATAASGTAPPFGQRFSGNGGNYRDEGSSWVRKGTGSFSFKTSSQGYSAKHYLQNFRGTYRTACTGHTLQVRVGAIPVRRDGSFVFRFHDSGAWVKIWGSFGGTGRRASVNYLANFSSTKSYDQRSPGSLGCAAWVRGTAHTG